MTVYLLLLILSLVAGILATASVAAPPRLQWFPLAFTLYIGALLFGAHVIATAPVGVR